jgi:hypothetical protein
MLPEEAVHPVPGRENKEFVLIKQGKCRVIF